MAGKIGQFEFFVARPVNMAFRQQRLQTLQFAGVDDPAFRLMGFGSAPWQLQTRTDLDSDSDAWNELLEYRDLISGALHPIEIDNVLFSGAEVKVMDVKAGFGDIPPVRNEKGVGFVNGVGSRWIASAQWTLIWVGT